MRDDVLFSDMLYMLVSVFSLKVMVLFFGCVGGLLVVLVVFWLVRVLSSKEYVCCVCDPSVCLGVPS